MASKNNVAMRQLNYTIDQNKLNWLTFAVEVKYFSLEHA